LDRTRIHVFAHCAPPPGPHPSKSGPSLKKIPWKFWKCLEIIRNFWKLLEFFGNFGYFWEFFGNFRMFFLGGGGGGPIVFWNFWNFLEFLEFFLYFFDFLKAWKFILPPLKLTLSTYSMFILSRKKKILFAPSYIWQVVVY
jgi:hypothetical protein